MRSSLPVLAVAIGVAGLSAPVTAQAQRFGITAGWAQSNLTTYYAAAAAAALATA